ncbi:MAG: hypothetical protein RLN81_12345 [Balneolaceae bacterium]
MKRVFRAFEEAGINPVLGSGITIFLFVVASHLIIQKEDYGPYLYLLVAVIFLNVLNESSRNNFLKGCFKDSDYRIVRVLENIFLAVPFAIFFMAFGFYFFAFGLMALSIALSLFTHSFKSGFALPTPFSKRPFEFAIGFRKAVLLIILSYTTGFVAIYIQNFNLAISTLVVLFLIMITFYSLQEDTFFVWIHSMTANSFILSKVATAISFSLLFTVGLALPLIVFFPENLYLVLLIELLGITLVVTSLLGKYATFPSESSLVHGLIITFSLVFPYLLIFIIPFLYLRSRNKLKLILK